MRFCEETSQKSPEHECCGLSNIRTACERLSESLTISLNYPVSFAANVNAALAPLVGGVGCNRDGHGGIAAADKIGRRGVDRAIIIGDCRSDPTA